MYYYYKCFKVISNCPQINKVLVFIYFRVQGILTFDWCFHSRINRQEKIRWLPAEINAFQHKSHPFPPSVGVDFNCTGANIKLMKKLCQGALTGRNLVDYNSSVRDASVVNMQHRLWTVQKTHNPCWDSLKHSQNDVKFKMAQNNIWFSILYYHV